MFLKKLLVLSIFLLAPFILSCDEALEMAVAAEPIHSYYSSDNSSLAESRTILPVAEIEPVSDVHLILPEETDAGVEKNSEIAARIASSLTHAAVISGIQGAQTRLTNVGMPKNIRQTIEGYWIGAWPTQPQIEELHARGIRAIITAANIGFEDYQEIADAIQKMGMTHISIPFGGRFPNPEKFEQTIQNFTPEQVYIHCEHGGDRSGAVLAYLLIVHHGWSVQRAFLSVTFPGKMDSQALVRILENRGYEVSDEDLDEVLGIYSGENNGGHGGLKVRSEGYVKLVNTTIDAAIRQMKKNG